MHRLVFWDVSGKFQYAVKPNSFCDQIENICLPRFDGFALSNHVSMSLRSALTSLVTTLTQKHAHEYQDQFTDKSERMSSLHVRGGTFKCYLKSRKREKNPRKKEVKWFTVTHLNIRLHEAHRQIAFGPSRLRWRRQGRACCTPPP